MRRLWAVLCLMVFATTAVAQTSVAPCTTSIVSGRVQCTAVSATNPLPTTAVITPSGTQDVNVTQILGAAVSATNPLFVSPATSSTWAATQSGTWNIGTVTTVTTVGAVTAITNALPAGTNLLGKAGLDQTTPGTTNAVSLAQIGATTVATGNGVVGTGVQRVSIASDNTAFSVNATLSAETTKVIGTVNIAAAQSIAATQSGTWTVQPGNTANTTAWLVTPTTSAASTAGSTTGATSALAANLVIKASAGNLYGLQVSADSTLSAVAWWLMVYDATSAPGDGAVTPTKCYAFPAGTTSASLAFPTPAVFATGITVGVSTTGCFTKTASIHAFIAGDFK